MTGPSVGLSKRSPTSIPGVEVSAVVTEGDPARVLVAAAKDAHLLVVGSLAHGEIVGILLGSVSEYCTTHARCPVVVVHHGQGTVVGDGDAVASTRN